MLTFSLCSLFLVCFVYSLDHCPCEVSAPSSIFYGYTTISDDQKASTFPWCWLLKKFPGILLWFLPSAKRVHWLFVWWVTWWSLLITFALTKLLSCEIWLDHALCYSRIKEPLSSFSRYRDEFKGTRFSIPGGSLLSSPSFSWFKNWSFRRWYFFFYHSLTFYYSSLKLRYLWTS